jgi:hypothetical protein
MESEAGMPHAPQYLDSQRCDFLGDLAGLAALLPRLRPFKVDDFVTAGGVTGSVEDIGLFGTTTPANVLTIVDGNRVRAPRRRKLAVFPGRSRPFREPIFAASS